MAALLVLTVGSASAQHLAIWKCTLPGGTFEVALRSVTAISSHQYVIEGGIQVTEVVIETNSSSTENRFYYMEPLGASSGVAGDAVTALQEKAQAASDHLSAVTGGPSASDLLNTTVVKSYPTTTHAHTVEYRLASAGQLADLFSSIESAWASNTNTSFAPATTSSAGGSSSGGGTAGQ